MSMLLQANLKPVDVEAMRDALARLREASGHSEGFISLRIFQDRSDPSRLTMLEEWESVEAFETAFAAYAGDRRQQFLERIGVTPDSIERTQWLSTGLDFT
jgi:quinol monooxygenase YgiN